MKSHRVYSHKVCTPSMVSKALKKAATRDGLPEDSYSFHSLRKGGVTQMKALAVGREEILSRGNYSASSTMIDTVYNYDSSGMGPLAATGKGTGCLPGKEEARRRIPVPYDR